MNFAGDYYGQAVLLLLIRRGQREGAENSQSFLLRESGKAHGDLRGVPGRPLAGFYRERRWAQMLTF